jgi:NAD(P)-dependent dehydrogenase (short-subunit alcohol dehydrogenase family)
MSEPGTLVVIGGTSGLGWQLARQFATNGYRVVISGRDAQRAEGVAKEIAATAGGPAEVTGIGLDLTRPAEIAERLSVVDRIDHLVLTAIERDHNTVREYDAARAGDDGRRRGRDRHPAPEPVGQRHRPVRRWRLAADLTTAGVARTGRP